MQGKRTENVEQLLANLERVLTLDGVSAASKRLIANIVQRIREDIEKLRSAKI